MRFIGWIIALISVLLLYFVYTTQYQPLKKKVTRLEEEIEMWEQTIKGQKEIGGDKNRFPSERFFVDDALTPYGEVEILRQFDRSYKGIEIYISAPNALNRASDLLRFLKEQRIVYQNMRIIAVNDSIERFEYKYTK